MKSKTWLVYLLECLDGSYYTGIALDVDKRIEKHISGKGSKYVYSHGFKKVLMAKRCDNKSLASKEEYRIKQLSKEDKIKCFF